MRKIDEIILHCTATVEGIDYSVDQIRRFHTDAPPKGRGWSDIGYHFLILRDGTVEKGRPIEKIGAHCLEHNANSIGICYVGGLDCNGKPKDTRTPQQKVSLIDLVLLLMHNYHIPESNVHCHYEFANKACPCFKIEDFITELHEE